MSLIQRVDTESNIGRLQLLSLFSIIKYKQTYYLKTNFEILKICDQPIKTLSRASLKLCYIHYITYLAYTNCILFQIGFNRNIW